MEKESFGDFLRRKRTERGITLRNMAKELGVSAPYLMDVEYGRRNALVLEKLERLAVLLEFNAAEKAMMYDLAGEQRDELAPDLPEYIRKHDYVSAALRTARDMGAGEEEWKRFVDELKSRRG